MSHGMAGALLANPTMDRYAQQGGYAEWFIVDPAIPSIRIKPYLDVVSAGNKSQWFALRTASFAGKKPKFLLEKSTIWFGLTALMWIGVGLDCVSHPSGVDWEQGVCPGLDVLAHRLYDKGDACLGYR